MKQKIVNFFEKNSYLFLALLSTLFWLIIMSSIIGQHINSDNPYNSFALQANSWRLGRLDLGQDYPHLELAIYQNKYFVSFPPFPSYLLFPFTFIWHENTPDFAILWVIDLILTYYLFKLSYSITKNNNISILLTLFFIMGSNTSFIILTPFVWFFAQSLCITLAVMAIYYAYIGKGALSLLFWAFSVGCRPMQALFFPILIILLVHHYKKTDKSDNKQVIIKLVLSCIPMMIVALSYMLLNYARFDSPLEFGHNYLPEFTRAEYGQFNIHYLRENFHSLINLPEIDENGRLVINHFGNLNFLIASPIIIFSLIVFLYLLIKRNKNLALFSAMTLLLSSVYLFVVVLHKTMGAWHFGNRYSIDILPYILLIIALGLKKYPKLSKYQIPLFIGGFIINTIGTIIVYNS